MGSLGMLGFVLFLLLGVVVWFWARGMRERLGVPAGNVIYADDGAWFPQTEPLTSNELLLVGKPDYLVEQADGSLVPVEVKSGVAPSSPREGHILQLAAYCYLVEENYGSRPTHGILQYEDEAFAIEYSEDIEYALLDLLTEMREDMFAHDVDRDHQHSRKCQQCGVKQSCSQRLDVATVR